MKKTKKTLKVKAGPLTVGPFRKVTYYQADIEGTDDHLELIASVGKQVITQEQYINIGINHIITHMVDNKFAIASAIKNKKSETKPTK
jgi:hypothetical protein